MTELEFHLLEAVKRLEAEYQERDQMLSKRLQDLATQLTDGEKRIGALTAQVNILTGRIARLQQALNKR
jgi:chaperonin cofactor prefoldin